MKKSIFNLPKKRIKKVEKAYKRTAFGKLTERAISLTFILILATWLCELAFDTLCNKNFKLNQIDFTGLFIAFVTYAICRLIQLKFIKDFYNEKYSQRKNNERQFLKQNNDKNFRNQKKWQ